MEFINYVLFFLRNRVEILKDTVYRATIILPTATTLLSQRDMTKKINA